MTAIATAPDVLDASMERLGNPARLRCAVPDGGELVMRREAVAAREFMAWFQRQRHEGGIAMPAENVLEVLPSLSRSFCIGLHDLRYFIGVPRELVRWFFDLPWLCAEVGAETSLLSLHCRRSHAAAAPLPAFTLNFDVQPPGYLAGLVHYHFLDVRAIDAIPANGGPFGISREVYMTLDIRVSPRLSHLRDSLE
jgi:hypothetical protein